jgi:hypothetical protein
MLRSPDPNPVGGVRLAGIDPRPYLRANGCPQSTSDHAARELAAGRAELWAIIPPGCPRAMALVVLRLDEHPVERRRCLYVLALAGQGVAPADIVRIGVDLARDNGAALIEFSADDEAPAIPRLARVLGRRHGFRPTTCGTLAREVVGDG